MLNTTKRKVTDTPPSRFFPKAHVRLFSLLDLCLDGDGRCPKGEVKSMRDFSKMTDQELVELLDKSLPKERPLSQMSDQELLLELRRHLPKEKRPKEPTRIQK